MHALRARREARACALWLKLNARALYCLLERATTLAYFRSGAQILWLHCLPQPIKQMINKLIHLDLIEWDHLLEDGNLFWEICFTERPGTRRPTLAAPVTIRNSSGVVCAMCCDHDALTHQSASKTSDWRSLVRCRVDRAGPLAPDGLQFSAGTERPRCL